LGGITGISVTVSPSTVEAGGEDVRGSPGSTRHRIVVLVAAALAATGLGPCGPIPGGTLSGSELAGVVDDWSFANEVPRCAVEVQPSDPHSVTVNCMSWERRLFVSGSKCAGKTWSAYALEDPRGRIQIGESVYPVLLTRVEEPGVLDSVWRARAEKLGEDDVVRAEGWWAFELRSR
jgi:hypothetical protein